MFGWLRKVFMNRNNNTVTPAGVVPASIMTKVKVPRKFEIFVEEYDEEGGPGHTPIWKPVKVDSALGGMGGNPTIIVNSQEDMLEKQKFYRDIGQRFRILREIDPPSPDKIIELAIEQGIDVSDYVPANANQRTAVQSNDVHTASPVVQLPQHNAVQPVQADSYVKPKPKIVTIGDMQIKYDGDKVYQKQWVRLTATEASNIRIVNDSNNKLVPLTGKHIEAKRWVMVEETNESDDVVMEGIIDG